MGHEYCSELLEQPYVRKLHTISIEGMLLMFLHLKPTTTEPCSLRWDEFEAVGNLWLCRGCNWIYPVRSPVDVPISQQCLKNVDLTFLMGTGILLANEALLSKLPRDLVQTKFELGNVTCRDGRKIEKWKSINPVDRIIVRGFKNVSFRICAQCKRNVYFAQGDPHVLKSQINNRSVFGTDGYGILVEESIVDTTGISKLRGVEVEKVACLEEPLDGYPPLTWSQPS